MKPIYWVFVSLGATFFILGLNIAVILIASARWLWLWLGGGFVVLGWSIAGITILVIKIRKKPPIRLKMDIGTAKKRAVHEIKYEEDNPDNLKINWSTIRREGKEGAEKTPIAVIRGVGTETGARINVLMNLNDIKAEPIRVDDVSDDILEQVILKFAENPDIREIEERIQSIDPLTRLPTQTVKVTRSSSAQLKEKEEKEAAEIVHAM